MEVENHLEMESTGQQTDLKMMAPVRVEAMQEQPVLTSVRTLLHLLKEAKVPVTEPVIRKTFQVDTRTLVLEVARATLLMQ